MKLWTWHEPVFFLLNGHLDHQQSEYMRDVDGLAEAYSELAVRIPTAAGWKVAGTATNAGSLFFPGRIEA